MRKIILLCLLGISSFCTGWSQAGCELLVTDSIKALYQQDAEQIYLQYFVNNRGKHPDPILIPQEKINPILSTLLAIHSNRALPHWEEVIEQYQIHAQQSIPTQEIRLVIDTALLKSFQENQNPADYINADHQMEALLSTYKFTVSQKSNFIEWEEEKMVYLETTFRSSLSLNLEPLLQQIRTIDGVIEAEGVVESTKSETIKDISFEKKDGYIQVSYQLGWNCTSSETCADNHYWVYKVFSDCRVEFAQEDGSLLPTRDIPTFLSTGLFPNPTSDKFSVQFLSPSGKEISVVLFSALGQIIQSQTTMTQSGLIKMDFSLEDLPVGMYFLGLISEGKVLTEKIIKK